MKKAPLVIALLLFAACPALAATLDITITDARGAPVEDAVAWAIPKWGSAPVRRREAAVEQKDKVFIPRVSVVQVGTAVPFPNRDEIRHHVYSFSAAKTFELKLYAGTQTAPTVVFDKPGEVILGCNIHDHMIASVYVVDTPWFAKAGRDGKARIDGLPAGEYDVHVWHYAQAGAAAPQRLRLRGDETQAATLPLALRATAPRLPPK